MKLESLEIFLVILIIGIQFVVFFRTWSRIYVFREIVPPAEEVSLIKVYIPEQDLDVLHPKDILDNIDKYRERRPAPPKTEIQSLVQTLIHYNKNVSIPAEKSAGTSDLFLQENQYSIDHPKHEDMDEFSSYNYF